MEEVNETIDAGVGGELKLDARGLDLLARTAKWSKFMAIVIFIGVGLMVLVSLLGSAFMSNITGGSFFSVILNMLVSLLYIFPALYLFRFSVKINEAIMVQDHFTLSDAFENLYKHYRFIGILMIVMFGLMVLGGLFAGLGLAMS